MPEVIGALKRWLRTWAGIGHVVVGMERQGYAVSVQKIHDDGWAGSFHDHPMFAPPKALRERRRRLLRFNGPCGAP